jgi:hypothetical protein
MFTFCQECMQVMAQAFIHSEGIYQHGKKQSSPITGLEWARGF